MKRIFLITGVFIVIISVVGCQNRNQDKESKDKLIDLNNIEEEIDERIFYRFPSPQEIFKFIRTAELVFNKDVLNESSKKSSYLDSKSQSINLGVYIAEVAYLTMFEQHEISLDYFMSIHALSEELKISAAFDMPIIERISDNLDNSDSLMVIADDAYDGIVKFLVDNNQEDVLALISAGALIETLYLTVSHVGNYSKDNLLIQKIADQKYTINNLMQYVAVHQSDKEIIAQLEKLDSIFSKIEETKSETTIQKSGNKLVIGGGSSLNLSEDIYVELKTEINSIRNKYINY